MRCKENMKAKQIAQLREIDDYLAERTTVDN